MLDGGDGGGGGGGVGSSNSSSGGGGDDDDVDSHKRGSDPSRGGADEPTVRYIDETGLAATAAPTHFIGDEVSSTRAPAPGPRRDPRRDGNERDLDRPLFARLRRFDMFISARRVASVRVTDTFFELERGAVLPWARCRATRPRESDARSRGRVWVGAGAAHTPNCPWCGDYTEAPFEEAPAERNTPDVCASEAAVSNQPRRQFAACQPRGGCGNWAEPPLRAGATAADRRHDYGGGGYLRLAPTTTGGVSDCAPCATCSSRPKPKPKPPKPAEAAVLLRGARMGVLGCARAGGAQFVVVARAGSRGWTQRGAGLARRWSVWAAAAAITT